ncbi:PAP2-like protein 2 [Elsinoe fawcettii]|nr:PAP2-like protein 2 [Elsinoe fawcettii]
MKLPFAAFTVATSGVLAAYPGDIVQYWADQGSVLINGSVIGGLQSPPSAWGPAVVHGAVYLAATEARNRSLEYQQLAVSHAAHNSLVWLFHGTRNFGATNAALRRVLPSIGLSANSSEGIAATSAGRDAARRVVTSRADDGINDFVDYVFGPREPGVYQNTSGGNALPDTPQARFVRLFASVGDVSQFQIAPPPSPNSPEYEPYIDRVIARGERNSTVRRPYDTETAYYWRESSISQWTRFANEAIGEFLAEDVEASAKYYAQFYYALANAGFASWYAKYRFNAWRPITAIRFPEIYLSSGRNISNPAWTPLLATPSHQDYTSTHATFGGAAAQVIRSYLGTDEINITVTSNVTVDGVGEVTRTYTSLTEANRENGESRVFGGIHFDFAAEAGNKLGTEVALKTLENFDEFWDEF